MRERQDVLVVDEAGGGEDDQVLRLPLVAHLGPVFVYVNINHSRSIFLKLESQSSYPLLTACLKWKKRFLAAGFAIF